MHSDQQYILARDTIDMIRDYEDNVGVLEYLDGLCFSMARILENNSVVEWDTLAGICDQRYYSLKNTPNNTTSLDVSQSDKLYAKYLSSIEARNTGETKLSS